MAITYPPDCDIPRKRYQALHVGQEILRYVHNLFSRWYHNEITQAQYDNPPMPQRPPQITDENWEEICNRIRAFFTFLKTKYPYKPRLTQEDWDEFYRDDFSPRSHKICTQINIQRRKLKQLPEYDIKVEDI